MPNTTHSILKLVRDPFEASRLYESALAYLEQKAASEFGVNDFIIRDMLASDMPGYTNNQWTEATIGSANTWQTTQMGNGGEIADDTVLLIYAMSSPTVDAIAAPDVTAYRFTIGAALRSQVSLYQILKYDAQEEEKIGYFMTPIVVTKRQNMTIDEYVVTTAQTHEKILYGLVAEKSGKLLEA